MLTIEKLSALEILDSRGRPTVQAACRLAGGALGVASVPSGASTGASEAVELRDGDARRYRGLGCLRAVANVNDALHPALAGRSFASQEALDRTMLELDGTTRKSRLGANTILAVSLAFSRAAAQQRGVPLYEYFAALVPVSMEQTGGGKVSGLPRPIINLFSGGRHAGNQAPLQDVLIVPAAAETLTEALAMMFEIYQCAAELTAKK